MANTYTYTRREEVANAVTHGIGTTLSVAALVLLIVFAAEKGTALHVVSFTIYGVAMLLLYTASTLVHSFREGRAKQVMEVLDHSFIYVFIAGKPPWNPPRIPLPASPDRTHTKACPGRTARTCG